MYAWDTVHYLLAQDRYDIPSHQPHPPGSLYYVLLARLARMVTHDPHLSLLLLSALFGGALVWGLFQLGRELGGERAGWFAAVIGATAPIFWFFGSVGLNYGPSGTLAVCFALACVRAGRGRRPAVSVLLAGALLALLGGFRPTDQVFLFPAYAWTLARAWRRDRRSSQGSVVLMSVLTLGWLIPNALSCGGFGGYVAAIRGQEHLIQNSSVFLAGWPAWREVLFTHRRCLESTLGAAWVPVLVWAIAWAADRLQRGKAVDAGIARRAPGAGGANAAEAVLLALIIIPAFLFYLLVHFNSPGYALTYSGLLAAMGGVAAARLPERCGEEGRALCSTLLAAAIAVGNGLLFMWGWPGVGNVGHRAMSWAEIRDHDRYYAELESFLARRYAPGTVRVLSSWNFTDGLRIVETLLPGHGMDVAQAVGYIPQLPPSITRLGWLRLMTPEQLRREGRPLYAVTRTREDPPYHRALFHGTLEPVAIGPGHVLFRISRPLDGRSPPP